MFFGAEEGGADIGQAYSQPRKMQPSAILHTSPMNPPQRIAGFDVHIEGEGSETLVMLHGWPDTWRLWDAQMPVLRPHYRCVRLTLPGFEPGQPARAVPLAELITGLRQVVETVSPGQPVILMLHDWGCLFGYQFVMEHPSLISRLIGLDIGDAASQHFVQFLSARQKAMIFGYQARLALAWFIGGDVRKGLGTRMTRWMARQLRCRTDPQHIHVGMNYPYFITWTGRHGSYRGLQAFEPPCPMLFVYGRRKPVPFHTPGWAERVAARPGSRVVPMDAGHWMMVQQPQLFNATLMDWLGTPVAASADVSDSGQAAGKSTSTAASPS